MIAFRRDDNGKALKRLSFAALGNNKYLIAVDNLVSGESKSYEFSNTTREHALNTWQLIIAASR